MLARMEYYAPCHLRPSWCLHAGTDGVLRPCAICARLVPPCWHGWSITPRAICARPGASMLARMEYYDRVPFAPVWCLHAGTDGILRPVCHLRPSGASTPSCYTHYSKSRKLEFWQRCPLLAARYRLYRPSQILGNCKQM